MWNEKRRNSIPGMYFMTIFTISKATESMVALATRLTTHMRGLLFQYMATTPNIVTKCPPHTAMVGWFISPTAEIVMATSGYALKVLHQKCFVILNIILHCCCRYFVNFYIIPPLINITKRVIYILIQTDKLFNLFNCSP